MLVRIIVDVAHKCSCTAIKQTQTMPQYCICTLIIILSGAVRADALFGIVTIWCYYVLCCWILSSQSWYTIWRSYKLVLLCSMLLDNNFYFTRPYFREDIMMYLFTRHNLRQSLFLKSLLCKSLCTRSKSLRMISLQNYE